MKINNEFLKLFYEKDQALKALEKEVKDMKEQAKLFLSDRKNKSFITADFIALLEEKHKKSYVVAEST